MKSIDKNWNIHKKWGNKESKHEQALMSYKKKLCIVPECIRTIAPKENCPPVKVRVWVRVMVSFRVGGGGGNFSRGQLS